MGSSEICFFSSGVADHALWSLHVKKQFEMESTMTPVVMLHGKSKTEQNTKTTRQKAKRRSPNHEQRFATDTVA